MSITLANVEAAAPDQASLKAARGLLKPAKWPVRGSSEAASLIWGECQGSGANPYRVVADLSDLGTKCTCPSRKFPCKHGLALMWMRAAGNGSDFPAAEIPDWVNDWLSRRRPNAQRPTTPKAGSEAKSIASADLVADARPDPEAEAKKEAARQKRLEDTRARVAAGLIDLEQWIADQLRLGIANTLSELAGRARQIAARLVDAKAQALSSRLDELPARMLLLPESDRGDALLAELGQLVLLIRAHRRDPTDPGLWRQVVSTEDRETLLANSEAPRVRTRWEVLGEKIHTRRDGLVSHETWLLDVALSEPRFALLLDHYPASAGKRASAFSAGAQFEAEICFYPSSEPRRGLIVERSEPASELRSWSLRADLDPLEAFLRTEPWSLDVPVALPPGRIGQTKGGRQWWVSRDGKHALPLRKQALPAVSTALDWEIAVALWDGFQLDPLAIDTRYGRIHAAS